MAKADKEKRLKLARKLLDEGLSKNEVARQLAKKFKMSVDSGKNDVREVCRSIEESDEGEEEGAEVVAAEVAPLEEQGEPMVMAMLANLKLGRMPSIEEINDMTLMRMMVTMLSAPYEKDRIAAARAVTKICGLDSPEFRKWQKDAKKNFDPAARRMEIISALGLGKKS